MSSSSPHRSSDLLTIVFPNSPPAVASMTEVAQSFISVHLHHKDPSVSIFMAKLISFITKEHDGELNCLIK
ncbi:hypothetical protein F2Q68_00009626 [Brassica cretica]|uniref:Uncharacterized protein n=1 Tax=Brassica cretica TaxID=69181 RepID=A0A8S9KUT3_BRACR|nr:hypothetical protein F2Q68_00009626 [Brassica cretica]